MAATRDLNAVCILKRYEENEYYAEFQFFLPEAALELIPKHYLDIFDVAIQSGILKLTEGNVMDDREISEYIKQQCEKYDVKEVGYDAYNAAKTGIIKQYSRVPVALHNIQNVLTHKVPIVFGCTLYDSFESNAVASNGMVPMPSANENQVGGHCMLMVGYTKTHFIIRNSWGAGWGDQGYCYMPFDY